MPKTLSFLSKSVSEAAPGYGPSQTVARQDVPIGVCTYNTPSLVGPRLPCSPPGLAALAGLLPLRVCLDSPKERGCRRPRHISGRHSLAGACQPRGLRSAQNLLESSSFREALIETNAEAVVCADLQEDLGRIATAIVTALSLEVPVRTGS